MEQELKKELERINKKLNDLAARQRKDTWVSASWITDLTGWDFIKLRQARRDNVIEYKGQGKGIVYKLESLPEVFIKKPQPNY